MQTAKNRRLVCPTTFSEKVNYFKLFILVPLSSQILQNCFYFLDLLFFHYVIEICLQIVLIKKIQYVTRVTYHFSHQ